MPHSLIRYALDYSGTNPDNLVQNEKHQLVNKRVRAIAPVQGAIFADGAGLVDDANGRILVHSLDYVFAQINQTLSVITGKDVVEIILIVNPNVSSNVTLHYQCVGGDFNLSTTPLVNLLNTASDDEYSKSYWDIRNRPKAFVPSPHIHDLGDGFGFEVLVYAMERLRAAIDWSDSVAIDSLFKLIDDYLANLTRNLNHRIDTELLHAIMEFKRSFTKELAGLGKVQNLGIATEEEGRLIAAPDFVFNANKDNKYIVTQALVGFKEVMYSTMVSSGLTNLGKNYGVLVLPVRSVFASLPNGARVMLDSIDNTKARKIDIESEVYPDMSKTKARWTVVKVSNNETNRGGILLAFNMNTADMYGGILTVTNTVTSIRWRKYMTEEDSDAYLKLLVDHIQDVHNPHKVTKLQAGLGNVENLGIATREDIICRKPKRVYVTYDGLLLFMKAFMTGVKKIGEIDEDDNNPSAVARYQMIFAPCGPCGGDDKQYSNVPFPADPTPVVKPRGELLVAYCIGFKRMGRFSDGFGGSYEGVIDAESTDCGFDKAGNYPPRGDLLDSYCEEFDTINKYADGAGGYYTRLIKANDPACGFVTVWTPTYEIRDITNTLLGYGFAMTDVIDPAATVTVYDDAGVALCMIYPTSGTGHTVQVRDIDNNILGYAFTQAEATPPTTPAPTPAP